MNIYVKTSFIVIKEKEYLKKRVLTWFDNFFVLIYSLLVLVDILFDFIDDFFQLVFVFNITGRNNIVVISTHKNSVIGWKLKRYEY